MRRDVLPDFVEHCLSFIDPTSIKPLRIVVDCGNGMGGLIVPAVFKQLPVEVVPLYFELDGTFPNHPASPIEPENMVDLQRGRRASIAPTSARPSTATPIACSSPTSTANSSAATW